MAEWKRRTRRKQLLALAMGLRRLRRRRLSNAREALHVRAKREAARIGLSVQYGARAR